MGTYRDVEVDRAHPLSAALAELRRVEQVGPYPFNAVAPLMALGRHQEAAQALSEFLELNCRRLVQGEGELSAWMVALLLDSAVALTDRALATELLDLVARAESATGGIWHLASIDRYRGAAAAFLGDSERARAYLTQAVATATKIRFRPDLALNRFRLAELLLDQYPAERTGALAHLDFAIAEFRAMKMAPFLEQAVQLRLAQQGLAGADAQTSIDTVADSVGTERPDLAPQAAPDGTVTLLFSDIEGSTAINPRLGDRRYMDLLGEHNALIRVQLAAHHGFEVKNQGDGFMLAFKSATDGLRCAIGIQQALTVGAETAAEPVQVRIGLQTGEAIRVADDFFGTHVNLAARIGAAAAGGGILVSALLKELATHAGEFRFGEAREVELKGIGPQRVQRVEWA